MTPLPYQESARVRGLSAARAFLRPNLSRQNLTLLTNSHVTRLTFTGTRCSGIELLIDGQQHNIGVSCEVILSAGGVGSAKVLMLSGVGDAAELRSLDIVPVMDLKGVGRSYHDHVLLSGVAFEYRGKMPDRPADSNAVEAEAYLSSGVDNGGVDLALRRHGAGVFASDGCSRRVSRDQRPRRPGRRPAALLAAGCGRRRL